MIPQLAAYCQAQGVQFLSSVFSSEDFAALDPFVTLHKIASYEIGHIHLLNLAAKSGKPLLLSTGAATEEEIAWAVHTFLERGGQNLTLLQCTACYPAEAKSLHLRTIPWLQMRFQTPVGLSDHSRQPLYAPVAAVALGATVIEKHFTLDNKLSGPDHAFAIVPSELKEMVQAIRHVEEMLGNEVKGIDVSEQELRSFAKRGIQAIAPIKRGAIFKEGVNIAILRPGVQILGVHPKYLPEIEGKKAHRAIALGEGVQLGDWL
jgi:sialic acid synthase SpsE